MENMPSVTKLNKSITWKAGMVIVSYFVVLIPVTLILGAVWLMLFVNIDQSLAQTLTYVYTLLTVLAGLVGIRYGVRYISRKSIFNKSDVPKIIVGFGIMTLLIFGLNFTRGNEISYYALIVLIINCLGISYFSNKVISNN